MGVDSKSLRYRVRPSTQSAIGRFLSSWFYAKRPNTLVNDQLTSFLLHFSVAYDEGWHYALAPFRVRKVRVCLLPPRRRAGMWFVRNVLSPPPPGVVPTATAAVVKHRLASTAACDRERARRIEIVLATTKETRATTRLASSFSPGITLVSERRQGPRGGYWTFRGRERIRPGPVLRNHPRIHLRKCGDDAMLASIKYRVRRAFLTSIANWQADLGRSALAERLARSPPIKANRVQSPAGSPDFRKWDSCRTMPLVGGPSRGSPVPLPPPPQFRRRSIFTSITLIGSQDLAVKCRSNIFTRSCPCCRGQSGTLFVRSARRVDVWPECSAVISVSATNAEELNRHAARSRPATNPETRVMHTAAEKGLLWCRRLANNGRDVRGLHEPRINWDHASIRSPLPPPPFFYFPDQALFVSEGEYKPSAPTFFRPTVPLPIAQICWSF
ncbi:hypothetical protein PR048_016764 [Dryococelus australis]|uniref:Uncharacterized protein n=1 Tax=Dryococelus australis TaxID=614101 RepID=A0ABQ9H865_9NEOP|nr:hypothetical protein PR048_016764 [Dryococelus australis]